jgi:hypothetical protein
LNFNSAIPQPISKKKKSKDRKKKKVKGSEQVAAIVEKVEQAESTSLECEKIVEGMKNISFLRGNRQCFEIS